MKFEKKWLPVLSLALGMPMTFLISAVGLMKLVEMGVMSKKVGVILFLAVVINIISLMIVYAIRRKN